jgi:tetratricopeptide (TPR) repeat protein
MLGMESMPLGFSQKLKELTGGNPFFLQEVLKTIIEKTSLSGKDLVWAWERFDFSELRIPGSLREILCDKVKKLNPHLLGIVQTFAVFNRAVEAELLQEAFQKKKDELLCGLDSLEKMEILKAEKEGERKIYSFTNAQIREVIYEQMQSECQKKMHQHLGQLLEDYYRPNQRAYSEELACHFLNSYDEERALSYSLSAGRHSKKLYANNEAVRFFESALPLLERKGNRRVVSKIYDHLLELYQLLGKYDLAIQKFENWIKVCTESRKKAMAFEKIGMVYEKKGEYDLALEHLQKGIQYLEAEENTLEMARLCYDTGYVHARKGEFEQTKKLYARALGILKDKSDCTSQKETGKLLNATGIVHWFQSEYEKASEYFHKSIEIFLKIKDEEEIASPYNNLGNISFALGNIEETIEYYQKSLLLREKIGDINAMAGSYNNLGNAYYKKGNFSEALRNYKRSASIYSRIGARSSLIIPLGNMANISLDQADYQSALEYNRRCLEVSEKVGAIWNASINWHNQGCIFQFLNHLDKAIECAHKSYSLKGKLKDTFGKGGTFNLMGDIYRVKGEWFKSERYLNKALKINRELNSKPGEAECLKSWAELNLEAGNYPQAFSLLKGALKLSEESQDVGLVLSCLLLLGKTKLRAKLTRWEQESFSWEEIEKDLRSALERAESQQKPELHWETLASLGTLYQAQRKYTLATKFYKKSVNILREIYAKVPEEFRGFYLAEPKKIQLRKDIFSLKEEIKAKNRNLVGVV